MRRHRRELGCLTGRDIQGSLAEAEPHPSLEHVEPIVSRVHLLRRWAVVGLESHLERRGGSRRTAERPGQGVVHGRGDRPDHDVVVTGVVGQQRVEVHLQRPREWHEHVQADRAATGLDAADGGGTQVGPRRERVERPAVGQTEAAQSRSHRGLDVDGDAIGGCVERLGSSGRSGWCPLFHLATIPRSCK